VKATDELCTRTFVMHTLKSPRQKCQNSPTGGANPPRRGGSSPSKAPPWRRPWSVVRRVSTSKQTGDDHVLVHQPSTEVSQQGTVAQYHGGNDASEDTNETALSGTFNQCSSRSSGVMCSDLLAENTSRAAAFNTDYRRCNSALDTPASVEEQ